MKIALYAETGGEVTLTWLTSLHAETYPQTEARRLALKSLRRSEPYFARMLPPLPGVHPREGKIVV